jgi:hypothetical protein
VTKGEDFRLKTRNPKGTLHLTEEKDKPKAKQALANEVIALA